MIGADDPELARAVVREHIAAEAEADTETDEGKPGSVVSALVTLVLLAAALCVATVAAHLLFRLATFAWAHS